MNQKDIKIESTVTEQGLVVRGLLYNSEYQTDVYQGIVETKQLTNDGSPIADNFDGL